jgi:eukaryotic-like serine/threonine-protein kinase
MTSKDPVPGDGGGAEALAAGAIVGGKYQLEHTLGTGGMGVVWAARPLAGGPMVALKLLRAGPDGSDDLDSSKRFLREARAAASVRHPHVVAIREVLELPGGRPVMVMELLTGETLRTRLARGPRLSVEEAAGVLLPVASAVGTAHAQGIVHRDLKPDNIFLSQDPHGGTLVKVLDFGIAKVTRIADEHSSHAHGLTGTGEVLGTPNYMSPEQVFGERDIDQRADVWALGVILYECLAGTVPTKAANLGQVFKLIVAGGIKPLEKVRPDVPHDIAALVQRMLTRRREQRPFDLSEITAVLGRHTRLAVPPFGPPHIPGGGPVAPAPASSAGLATQGEAGTGDAAPLTAPGRRMGRLTTIGLGTLVVSVLIGESVLLWRGRSRRIESVPTSAVEAVAPADAARFPPAPPALAAPAAPAPASASPPLHQPRRAPPIRRPAWRAPGPGR